METKKTEMLKKAAQIVVDSGLEALTIQNLANELKLDEKELYELFTNEDEILLTMFNGFENELKEFIYELSHNHVEAPEKEFNILFKSLYNLFLQKPYYLDIIFDKKVKKRDERIKMSILRMKDIIENYLTAIIDTGKKDNTFKTQVPTKLLVNKMLTEFRLLMKDEQYINEMVLELKSLKKSKDE
ncbi:MAG TPA: hypothetical protein VK982_16285 [Bacteroidales bacterium]|nr:hypothetical protein [Bacteroidales bacterium]